MYSNIPNTMHGRCPSCGKCLQCGSYQQPYYGGKSLATSMGQQQVANNCSQYEQAQQQANNLKK